MKPWIFSDLHLEYGWMGLDFEVPQADVCIVAGGVHRCGPRRSIEFLAEHVPDLPVVFVAGNDEFRDSSVFEGLVDAGREAERCANIHLLGTIACRSAISGLPEQHSGPISVSTVTKPGPCVTANA